MEESELVSIITDAAALVDEHYVFPEVAAEVGRLLRNGIAENRYLVGSAEALAEKITLDLQSVNGDKHLRLIHHTGPLPEGHGDEETDLATMSAWADSTCGGVATVQRLEGNVGYLDLNPLLFPAAICGEPIAAAMTLLAPAEALIVDLRRCLGGEPTMVAFICSYLFGPEPVELTGLYERKTDRVKQAWTLPHVPGRRFGPSKAVYVLTGATTFSGGEALAYDLQQTGRATVIGERTRGGAHPRIGYKVRPHLEITIPVARAVFPDTGKNWEGTGVVPDIITPPDEAREVALREATVQLTST